MTAQAVQAMRDAGENFVIVDGRPLAEYAKMNIPGGICCPNGELALRIRDIVPDPTTKIVVNCAGRTRSIIGAQTLIDFGVANPVYALENGTQGWFLAGLALEHGANRRYGDKVAAGADAAELEARARKLASAHGVEFVAAAEANAWLADTSRTTYLLDVRTPEEFAAHAVPGFAHAPGGQLIQATDQWVGVRGARLVLVDARACAGAGGGGLAAPARPRGLCARRRNCRGRQIRVAATRTCAGSAPPTNDGSARVGGGSEQGSGANHRPAPQHGLPQGPHRAGRVVDPAAHCGSGRPEQDRSAGRRRSGR